MPALVFTKFILRSLTPHFLACSLLLSTTLAWSLPPSGAEASHSIHMMVQPGDGHPREAIFRATLINRSNPRDQHILEQNVVFPPEGTAVEHTFTIPDSILGEHRLILEIVEVDVLPKIWPARVLGFRQNVSILKPYEVSNPLVDYSKFTSVTVVENFANRSFSEKYKWYSDLHHFGQFSVEIQSAGGSAFNSPASTR